MSDLGIYNQTLSVIQFVSSVVFLLELSNMPQLHFFRVYIYGSINNHYFNNKLLLEYYVI